MMSFPVRPTSLAVTTRSSGMKGSLSDLGPLHEGSSNPAWHESVPPSRGGLEAARGIVARIRVLVPLQENPASQGL